MKHKIILVLTALSVTALTMLVLAFHIRLWPFELLVSSMPQSLLGLITVFILLVTAYVVVNNGVFNVRHERQNRIMMGLIILGILASLYSVVFSLTAQSPTNTASVTDQDSIRFATYNTLYTNTDFTKATEYLIKNDVDVAVFQEVDVESFTKIKEQFGYKYSYLSPNADTNYFGSVGMVSRLPVKDTEILPLIEGYAIVRAEIEVAPGQLVAFYGTHITGPFSNDKYIKSQGQIATLANLIAADRLPVIVGGDFNTTVFSPKLQEFNQLINAAVRPITQERWPDCTWYGFGPLACLRIDHVYIPKTARLHDVTISPHFGSDHRALIVELSL